MYYECHLHFVCSSTRARNCQCSTSSGVFTMYHIYIFSREEGSLSCLRLTQGVTPTGHAWPPLNSYFHPHFILLLSCSLHRPIASKVKQISLILFQCSFYLLYFFEFFLDFIICNNEINMLCKRSK
jgi:hypothetical protein